MIYIIPLHKILYSFTLTIVITATLQSVTVSVPTPHGSIYTVCMIYFLNHYYMCDDFIYIYMIYIIPLHKIVYSFYVVISSF